ncbi:MAG: hypothetical protein AABX89_06915 [Candidatus Thermoplasmatota archaeon]
MRRTLLVSLVALLLLANLPAGQAVNYGTFGGKVLPSSTDFNPLYVDTPGADPTICSRDTGIAATATDDLYYLNIPGDGTTVSAFDVRLTTAGGFSAGTLVSSSDADVSQSFNGLACTAFETKVGYVEADGLPGYSPGDQVVWSADAVLGTGDIRLSTSTPQDGSAGTAGTFVDATSATDVSAFGDNDGLYPDCAGSPPLGAACTGSAILEQGANFSPRFFDANINLVFDTGDSLYVAYKPASSQAPTSPSVNDLALFAGAGGSFGAKVARSSADYLVEPDLFGTAPVLATIGTAGLCSPLVIHFADALGAAAATVQMDDVILYSNVAACTSPAPASTVTAGTRVSTVAHFQGSALTPAAGVALAGLIYFVDANGNGYQDATDPVYLHRTIALGGTVDAVPTLGIVAGDLRLTAVTAGASSFTVGTVVGGTEADVGAFAGSKTSAHADIHLTTQSWFVRRLNQDGASETPLQTATLVKYVDAGTASRYDPTTDAVYVDLDSSGTVTAGDTLLLGTAAALTTVLVAGDFKVSGADATFDVARSESVYFSKDAFVNDEDLRVAKGTGVTLTVGASGTQVACPADADCTTQGIHTSDLLQFSWCVTATSCFGRLQPNDLQVAPTLGTRTTTAVGADFIPTLKALPTAGGRLLRQNLGEASSIVDDTFYISGGSATAVTTSAVRITPLIAQSKAAGAFVVTGDTIDLAAGATSSNVDATTKTAASLIRFRDTDGLGGYTLNDVVYMDLDAPAVVGAVPDTLTVADIRLSTQSSLSLTAGTYVLAGNTDLTAGTAFGAIPANAFTLMYFDDNLNGLFDNGDMLYAIPPSPASTTQPVIGAVYLAGGGGTTTGGTSGGGAPVVTTPVTTTATASSTAAPTSAAPTSAAPTTAADGTLSGSATVVAANKGLDASLAVKREDNGNSLTWTSQPGVSGYQVWSHTSPFVLLTTLADPSASSFRHPGADANTVYLVTAFSGTDGVLTAAQVNAGQVPGLAAGTAPGGDVATSETSSGKAPIPAPGLVFGVAAVALALWAARRRAP